MERELVLVTYILLIIWHLRQLTNDYTRTFNPSYSRKYRNPTLLTTEIELSQIPHNTRDVYSSRKSELFPSAKHHLPNPSLNYSPTSKLQLPPNQGHRCFFDIFWDAFFFFFASHGKIPTWMHRGVSEGGFALLKLESCNLMNTFGRKFRE